MKDFNENNLKIGDVVAFLEANYRDLKKGTIINFTEKMIVIEWNNKGKKEICRRAPDYVALIREPVAQN